MHSRGSRPVDIMPRGLVRDHKPYAEIWDALWAAPRDPSLGPPSPAAGDMYVERDGAGVVGVLITFVAFQEVQTSFQTCDSAFDLPLDIRPTNDPTHMFDKKHSAAELASAAHSMSSTEKDLSKVAHVEVGEGAAELAAAGHVATDAHGEWRWLAWRRAQRLMSGNPLFQFDAEAERRLVRKIDWCIVPTVSILYLFCFIDVSCGRLWHPRSAHPPARQHRQRSSRWLRERPQAPRLSI